MVVEENSQMISPRMLQNKSNSVVRKEMPLGTANFFMDAEAIGKNSSRA